MRDLRRICMCMQFQFVDERCNADASEIVQIVSSLIFIEWFNISTSFEKMHEESKRDAYVGDVHKTAQQ